MRRWMGWAAAGLLVLGGCDDGDGGPHPHVDAAPQDAATQDAMGPDAADPDLGVRDAAPPADAAPADASADADAPDAAPVVFVPETPDQEALYGVPESLRRHLPGLEAPVHVVRTEADVPHIYAANRRDMARVHGFIVAQDRFWMMDLARRLALGRLSELVGDILIETDITSRATGLHVTAQRLLDALDADRRAELDAFAEGINAYVTAAKAGELPPPSELMVAAPLLGARQAHELMEPFTTLDVMGFAAVVMEQSTCARSELDRTAALLDTFGAYAPDAPFAAQREQALRDDIFYRLEPLANVFTVGGPAEKASRPVGGFTFDDPPPVRLPHDLLRRVADRVNRWREQATDVSGSNAWAVAGAHTADGATLLAGDGHLPLAVPPYFHQAGLDTGVLGGDPWHARGNFIAGLPALGVGTNGAVAWSFTCFYSDTIDYFAEEVRLGEDGRPDASMFGGEWRPLEVNEEVYQTRQVLLLESPGGPITQPLFVTFDGRRLLSIEGHPPADGEVGINLGDGPVVPGDEDGDGIVSAVSVDATYLDIGDAIGAYYALAEATDLDQFQATQRKLGVFGSHFVAADRGGRIMATGYHGSPCRADRPRTEDGRRFAPGADPQVVADGTTYGGFELRYAADGTVDESAPDSPACMVPYADFPRTVDPPEGYVVSANNDPSGLSRDGSLADDPIYIGGPWAIGLRAARIDALVAEVTAAGTATIADMARIQADTRSATGLLWGPALSQAIARGRDLQAVDELLEGADARIAALYAANQARFDAVATRIDAWVAADAPTPSGVETFYDQPAEGDAAMAVATMIFNSWLGHMVEWTLGDEPRTPGDRLTDDRTEGRTLDNLLAGRGPGNPRNLTSWDPDTEESVFFDVLGTEEIEDSDEVILLALADALDFLAGPPAEDGEGGFGTDDMDAWLWGLRHTVRFESILAPFVGDIGGFGALLTRFGITPDNLPLTEGPLPQGDPRRDLIGFPRPGDQYSVDNADPGLRPRNFEYRDGPVKRLVIALHPDGRVEGQNIVPGGQSGLTSSPHFTDQVALWLGNEALPLRFHLDQVVEGAVGREVYLP